MKTSLVFTPDELAEILAGVAEYNGYQPGSVSIFKEGQLVDYDEVVIDTTGSKFQVRIKPEETYADKLRQYREMWGTGGVVGGNHPANGEGSES